MEGSASCHTGWYPLSSTCIVSLLPGATLLWTPVTTNKRYYSKNNNITEK